MRYVLRQLGLLLLAVALLLAACSSDSDGTEDDGDATEAGTGSDAGTDDGAADADQGGDTADGPSGTLRHATIINFLTWDPHADQRTISLGYLNPVYEGLLRESTDGNDLIPELATEWTEDETGVTFTLREGVTFTDGTPFDAAAVVANFERVKADGHPVNKGLLANVESAEAIDDLTVRYNYSQFDGTVLLSLARFAGKMISPAAFDTVGEGAPVGTGPYIYNPDDSAADNSFASYDANPDYWNPDAQPVAKVEISFIADPATQTNAMLAGEFDTTNVGNVALLQQLTDAGMEYSIQPALGIGMHIIDRTGTIVPELADERVRKAMALAIDRDAFYDVVAVGYPTTQHALSDGYAFSTDMEDLGFDLEAAQALMAEAGNPEFSIDVPTFGPFNTANAFLASSWEPLGITLNTIDVNNIFAACTQQEGDFPIGLCPINERHIKHFIENRLLPDGFLNPFGHVDQEIIDLHDQAKNLPLDEAEPLYAEISKLAFERGYVAMVGWNTSPVNYNPETISGVDVRYIYPGVYYIGDVEVAG